MTEIALTFQEQLAALRETYSRGLPDKLERIALAWQEICDTRQEGGVESSPEEGWERLHRGVHSLAGSGASMGFPELSVAARELEVYLQGIMERGAGTPRVLDPSDIEHVAVLLNRLRACAMSPAGDDNQLPTSQRLPATPSPIPTTPGPGGLP